MTRLRGSRSVRGTTRVSRTLRFLGIQLLLLLAVSLVAFLAAEQVARHKFQELRYASYRQQRPEGLFVGFDPRYGWSNLPGSDVRFQRQDFDTRIRINADGFRGPLAPRPKPPGTRRIVVLGDSYTFGHGVEEEESFCALLDRQLPNVDVVNLGVTGYSTDQELLLLQDRGFDYEPDLVVLCLYRNDVLDNGQSTAWGLYRKPRFLLDGGTLRLESETVPEGVPWTTRLRRELRKRFVLYDVVTQRIAMVRIARVNAKDPEGSSHLTHALIEEMGRNCGSRRIPFLLVVLPNFEYPELVQDLPPEGTGARLDLQPIFDDYVALHPDSALGFLYDSHWNPRGHRLVAEAVGEKIREQGWVERP